MLLEDFNYELPEELIAQKPIEPRNFSRLMVLNPLTKEIRHEHFYDLQKFFCHKDNHATNYCNTKKTRAQPRGNYSYD